MKVLKEKLSSDLYDEVRKCLSLQPLKEAITAGQAVTLNVRKNIEEKASNQA